MHEIRAGVRILSLLALLAVSTMGPGGAGEKLEPVSVMFHWRPQAQWAGYYMAREKGIYAKYGLDVTLQYKTGRSDSLDRLIENRVTFATHFLSAGVGLYGSGYPVKLIGQMFNRSHLMVVARKALGVDKPGDLTGKTVCFWDGNYQFIFRAFFASQGVTNLTERPQGTTVAQFTSKQVAACSAMEYNEFYLIRATPGVTPEDLTVFMLRDMGFDFPEDAVYTTPEYARDRPDICRAFVAATLEGWAYARENLDETLEVVLNEISGFPDVPDDREHHRWMLEVCSGGIFPPEGSGRKPGVLAKKDFTFMRDFLRDNGQLPNMVEYEEMVALDAVEP